MSRKTGVVTKRAPPISLKDILSLASKIKAKLSPDAAPASKIV